MSGECLSQSDFNFICQEIKTNKLSITINFFMNSKTGAMQEFAMHCMGKLQHLLKDLPLKYQV